MRSAARSSVIWTTPNTISTCPSSTAARRFNARYGAISSIPSGRTLTYSGIAKHLRTAPRPVGGACGANRIPLVIPCHRVLGSGGIGGFMNARGGFPLEVKRWLLRHEGV